MRFYSSCTHYLLLCTLRPAGAESFYAYPCSDLNSRSSVRMRIAVKTRDEYRDVQTLPSALLAREGPVGPTRPSAAVGPRMITGRKFRFLCSSDQVVDPRPFRNPQLNKSLYKMGRPPILRPPPLLRQLPPHPQRSRPSASKNPSTPAHNPLSQRHLHDEKLRVKSNQTTTRHGSSYGLSAVTLAGCEVWRSSPATSGSSLALEIV